MKLLAAIQRIKNPPQTHVQSKSSTSASGKSMKIVNLNPQQKADAQAQVVHKKAKSQNQDAKQRASVHYHSIGSETTQVLHHQNSDASQQTVINQGDGDFQVNHSNSMDGTGNSKMLFQQRTDLNGSQNFNSSLKMNSGSISITQGKSSVRSSAQRQQVEG